MSIIERGKKVVKEAARSLKLVPQRLALQALSEPFFGELRNRNMEKPYHGGSMDILEGTLWERGKGYIKRTEVSYLKIIYGIDYDTVDKSKPGESITVRLEIPFESGVATYNINFGGNQKDGLRFWGVSEMYNDPAGSIIIKGSIVPSSVESRILEQALLALKEFSSSQMVTPVFAS